MNQLWIQLVISLAGIMVGLFGLFKYFLRHLEKKNGTIERMSQLFTEEMRNSTEKHAEMHEKTNNMILRMGEILTELKYKKQ